MDQLLELTMHLTASTAQPEVLSTPISELQETTLNKTAIFPILVDVELASTPLLEITANAEVKSHEHHETPTLLEVPSTSTKKVGPYEIAPLSKTPHQPRRTSTKLGKLQ
jgi:hypothetical protein